MISRGAYSNPPWILGTPEALLHGTNVSRLNSRAHRQFGLRTPMKSAQNSAEPARPRRAEVLKTHTIPHRVMTGRDIITARHARLGGLESSRQSQAPKPRQSARAPTATKMTADDSGGNAMEMGSESGGSGKGECKCSEDSFTDFTTLSRWVLGSSNAP